MKNTIVGFLAVALFIPVSVFAMDKELAEYNNKIYALQAQIAQLTQLLAQLVLARNIDQSGDQSGDGAPWKCFIPTHDLYIGRTDAQTSGEVSKLQKWLKDTGYFPDANVTGYYGEKTAAAVMKWQKAHGMDFVTLTSGVGKMTRAKMQERCSGSAQTPVQGAVIASFSGPKNLGVNVLGTWSVVAHDSKGEAVRYIVEWGDETFVGDIAHPANRVAFGGASEYSVPTFTHAYARAGTYTIKLSLFNPDLTRESRATTQVTVGADCPVYNSPPVISSITPSSGPVGTTIEVHGCNFMGFESDKYLWITNSSGVKGLLYGENDAVNTVAKAKIPERLCTADVSYSGLPCPSYLEMTPGVYSVRASSYGGSSNAMNFTVTQ